MKSLAAYSNTDQHKKVPFGKTIIIATMFGTAGFMLLSTVSKFI